MCKMLNHKNKFEIFMIYKKIRIKTINEKILTPKNFKFEVLKFSFEEEKTLYLKL